MKLIMVMLVVMAVAVVAQDCDHWCKTPDNKNYCCGPYRPGNPYPAFEVHNGRCPPIRDQCPPVRAFARRPPTVCPHDGVCQGHQKCCYDVCLEHHTCKRAQ